jgi:hypothetical protein
VFCFSFSCGQDFASADDGGECAQNSAAVIIAYLDQKRGGWLIPWGRLRPWGMKNFTAWPVSLSPSSMRVASGWARLYREWAFRTQFSSDTRRLIFGDSCD